MTNLIKILLGVSALIAFILFITWKNRQRIKPYYDRLEGLSKDLTGTISKPQRFFSDVPCLTRTFSGHKFP